MSPLADLRRRRAERVIAREIPGHEGRIRRAAASSLRRHGIRLSDHDFEDFMQEARLGLYGRLVEGEEVPNPVGFLVTVVTRRALDAKRKETVRGEVGSYEVNEQSVSVELDFAAQLDDEVTVRRFVEGAKTHLSPREAQAVALTHLFDLTRPKAAEVLGVAPKRMEKIMDGAMRKVGAYCAEISAGKWCESRRSMLNAYAFGVLDPAGARYKLATAHLDDCPACRHYVRRARGLAAFLPPVFLPLKALGGAGAFVGTAATGAAATQAAIGTGGSGAAAGGSTAGAAVAVGSTGSGLGLKAAATVAAAVVVGVGAANAPHPSSDNQPKSRTPNTAVVQTRTISRIVPTAPAKPKVAKAKRKSKAKRTSRPSSPATQPNSPPPASSAPQNPATRQTRKSTSTSTVKPSGAEFGVEG